MSRVTSHTASGAAPPSLPHVRVPRVHAPGRPSPHVESRRNTDLCFEIASILAPGSSAHGFPARGGAPWDMFIPTEQSEGDAVSQEQSKGTGRTAVVIGGTQGIGKEIVTSLAAKGTRVYLSGRTSASAQAAAAEIGLGTTGIAVDLAEPDSIAAAFAGIESVDELVIPAIERDANTIADYHIARAMRLVTLKLVGYAEVIHALRPRFTSGASVVLFGGLALERPYPGSTTVSTVNGGVVGLVNTLACELAPVRINAIHPGIIGDSPFWENKDNSHIIARTPLGRLVTMREIVGAVEFLLENTGINGVNLAMDGGWLLK